MKKTWGEKEVTFQNQYVVTMNTQLVYKYVVTMNTQLVLGI